MVVAPDLGAVKLAERYAGILRGPVAVVRKQRESGATVSASDIAGEAGEEIVIPVQGDIGGDVEFGAVQHRDFVATNRLRQLASLVEGLFAGHPLHRHQRGVISNGAVPISMAGSGGDHVIQASEAVGEIGGKVVERHSQRWPAAVMPLHRHGTQSRRRLTTKQG